MEDNGGLNIEDVRQYFVIKGGRVKNQDLVKHFKKYFFCEDQEKQIEARNQFKDYVNTLAIIKQEEGVKYLTLKKKYWDIKPLSQVYDQSNSSFENLSSDQSPQTSSQKRHGSPAMDPTANRKYQKEVEEMSSTRLLETVMLTTNTVVSGPPSGNHMPQYVVGSPGEVVTPSVTKQQYKEMPPNQPPRPPPRQKSLSRKKENRGIKIEERVKQFSEERQIVQESPKGREFGELTVSPGSVKERAQKLNKMASESELSFKLTPTSGLSTAARKRENRISHLSNDIYKLDPRRREWILKAAQSDYHSLVRLLKEEPKLAFFRDFITEVTALHWAAKHGNADVVKLMAGTHRVDANVRTQGGYTALHIAAMAGHEGIMELLTSTYAADPSIRDYSGRKPHQYLTKWQSSKKPSGSRKQLSETSIPIPPPMERTPLSRTISRTKSFRNTPFFRNALHQSFLRTTKPNHLRSSTHSKHRSAVLSSVHHQHHTKHQVFKMSDKELSFMRIGSLNSRVKKTTAALTGGRGVVRLKSCRSADNLSELLERQVMPPPKLGPVKKKKSKKTINAEFYSITTDKGDSDSDSAYGFHS
ncbi:ankyrin repeat domain-containing protein SOWAHB-like [Limulus polyphemus]|uniref:Ankyrin repeat domain-containing protein SOWAHB-like n=1 Tax=Limulus polyphemus TaxID=6850 RepID=A0ABM1S772_LIMPO|nr:ankyrin repeat domain-containing protein SOWAHB-like [Limulus polyphemus]